MVYELSRARLQATIRRTILRLGLYLSHFRRRTILSEHRSIPCLRLINSPAFRLKDMDKHEGHNIGPAEDSYGCEALFCYDCQEWV